MADSTFTDTSVVRFSENFVFFKANAEKDTALAEKYRVNGYPTVILANSSGQEIDRLVGYAPAPEFIKGINDLLAGKGTLADYENRVKQNPNDVELWFTLAGKYQERRAFEQAVNCFNKVVSLDPADKTGKASESLYELGWLYMGRNVKQYDKAVEAFQRVIKEYPGAKLALDAEEYIPYSYEKMADTTKAISLYKKFLQDHPTIDSSEREWVQKRIDGLEGKVTEKAKE
jgi:tetratricopeptide (TPR) repeat protein